MLTTEAKKEKIMLYRIIGITNGIIKLLTVVFCVYFQLKYDILPDAFGIVLISLIVINSILMIIYRYKKKHGD